MSSNLEAIRKGLFVLAVRRVNRCPSAAVRVINSPETEIRCSVRSRSSADAAAILRTSVSLGANVPRIDPRGRLTTRLQGSRRTSHIVRRRAACSSIYSDVWRAHAALDGTQYVRSREAITIRSRENCPIPRDTTGEYGEIYCGRGGRGGGCSSGQVFGFLK